MTNPSQLKYLEAMGIPVWVSRDSVVIFEDLQDSPNSIKNNVQPQANANSAKSILQSLNSQNVEQATVISASTSAQEQQILKPTETTKQTTLEDNSSPAKNEIARTASHIIYACGSRQADWMIIGESPELNDDRSNQPYSGDSGVLLENMLRAVGLENPRNDAYIINIIKASMQAIVPESVGELNQILNQKIKEVKPNIILIVGQLSAQNVLQSKEPLARLRAKAQVHPEIGTNIIVTYYPTHLLSKPIDKRKTWNDLKLAMSLMDVASNAPSE